MSRKRAPRLPAFDYLGPHRYFLTICAHNRRCLFSDATVVATALEQLRRAAADEEFTVFAYCFMPDHLHLLVEGSADGSDLRAFVHRFKQFSAYATRLQIVGQFWQRGCFERVVRDSEATRDVVRYIFENPIRARMVDCYLDHPFLGSDVFDISNL